MRLLLTLCCLLLATPAWAATYYVRSGAGGSNNGADWTNAYTSIPSLGSGNTYYISEGSYTLPTVTAANVVIRRCVDSAREVHACQSVSGWADSYGNGQATLGTITVRANGLTVDGRVRNATNWADGDSYGFRATSVYTSTFDTGGVGPDTVAVSFVNIGGTLSATYGGSENDAVYMGCFHNVCDGWTIAYNFLHNDSFMQMVTTSNAVIQYNRFQYGWVKESIRGQNGWSGHTIRYNQFYDACGNSGVEWAGCTAEIAAWDNSGSWDNNAIYGNWFYNSRMDSSAYRSTGTIQIGGEAEFGFVSANNNLVYNNTFVGKAGQDGNAYGAIYFPNGSGNICRNLLRYLTTSTNTACSTTSNNVVAGSNPFVNYAGADLHLTGATAAGYTLSSPYNVDMDGTTRAVDGTWDVGAYEYGTGGTPQTYQQSVSDSLSPTEGGVQYQYQGPAPTIRRGVTIQ